MILGVALKRAFVNGSELSAVTIRAVLLADIAADLFQLKPDGRNGIAPGPEMLAREIPFLAAQPGNRNGALPFEKPDHRSHRVLGGILCSEGGRAIWVPEANPNKMQQKALYRCDTTPILT